MNVNSATCSCSVELYKLWYTLADFLPKWNFRGVFYKYHYSAVRISSEAAMNSGHYIFRIPGSSFRVRSSSFRVRSSSVGCSVAQKDED